MHYFELNEFLESETASRLKIDNSPKTFEEIEHLLELRELLDNLREEWGSAINVTSGYRCPKLNKAVNGSSTSVHKIGYAADLQPANGKIKEFAAFVREWAKDKDFDQILLERSGSTKWVHIGLRNNKGGQRHIIKDMVV